MTYVYGDDGADTLSGSGARYGGRGDDVLSGDPYGNLLAGGSRNDTLPAVRATTRSSVA